MGKKQGGREGAERIQPSRAPAGEDRGQEAEEFETTWQPGEPIKIMPTSRSQLISQMRRPKTTQSDIRALRPH